MAAPVKRQSVEPTARRAFTKRQREVAWIAAEGRCENCRVEVGREFDIDHRLALFHGGAHSPDNWRVLCRPCHAEKTAEDASVSAKIRRLRKREAGEKKRRGREIRSNPKIRSAGFRGWRSMSGEARWRKTKD